MYEDKMIKIQQYDTPGESDFARLRSMQYSEAEVFILCFTLADPKSLEHIEIYWIPEIKGKNPDVPYILVGMKSDFRDSSSEKVTTEKGQEMKEKIGAQDYVECSSLNKIGLKDVMESVLKVLGQQIEKQKLENHVQILLLILIMALMILIKRKNHHHQMILIKLILFYNTFFLFKYEYISLILKLLPTYSSFLLKNIILLKKRNLFQNVMKDN